MTGKRRGQYLHTRLRAQERYGLKLDKVMQRHIISLIRANKAKFLKRKTQRITLWEIQVLGKSIIVAYDTTRGSIASVLPPNCEKGSAS